MADDAPLVSLADNHLGHDRHRDGCGVGHSLANLHRPASMGIASAPADVK
jgi:hypothetical protein